MSDWEAFKRAHGLMRASVVRYVGSTTLQNMAKHDAFEEALEDLEDAFRHYHEASDDGDKCGLCGLDIRNNIHIRST